MPSDGGCSCPPHTALFEPVTIGNHRSPPQVVVHGLFCCLSCFASYYIKMRMTHNLPVKWKVTFMLITSLTHS